MNNNSPIRKYKQYLMIERGLSANTIDAYMHDLDKLIEYAESNNLGLSDIKTRHIESLLADLYDKNITARSIARVLSGLKSFFNFLELDGFIDINPTALIESPSLGQKLPITLSIEEIDDILGIIDVSTSEGTRNYAIIETLYSCGLRVSELINLRFSDLFFNEGFIRVRGKGDKQRLVPISETAIQKIKNYIPYRAQINIKRGSEDVLFLSARGTAISRITVFHYVRKYSEEAGIDKDISPHVFRHSFATHLLERGANMRVIQEMMGHEKISTTEIYTHLDTQYLREEILEHHPRSKE